MKKTLFALFGLCLAAPLAAQTTGCDIRVKLGSYPADTIWLGQYFGKRAPTIFAATRQPGGVFNLKKEDGLSEGLYAIVFRRNKTDQKENFPVWLVDGQREFSVSADALNTSLARASGSAENTALFDYLSKYQPLMDSLNDATTFWKSVLDEDSFNAMLRAERNFRDFQDGFLKNNPTTKTAAMVDPTRFAEAPDGGGDWEKRAAARLDWQRKHFFDGMDLGPSGGFLKYPLWVERVDYFAMKLAMPEPQSLTAQLEDILARLEPWPEAHHYYFRYIMQSLGRISRFRTDEVYVSFVRKYVDGGRCDWMDAADLARYRDDASRLEPLAVGKKLPDVTLYDRDDKPVEVNKVEGKYALLVFWMYDCSHCKREIPMLVKMADELRAKGVKVLSVCGKYGAEEMNKCWDFAAANQMPADWLLLADPLQKSNYRSILNARSNPRLILVDENKTILYKQAGELPERALRRELERALK